MPAFIGKKIKKDDIQSWVISLLLVLLPFFFVWVRGRLFYDFDMTFITAPIEDMFARYQRAGQLPFWAPELQGGYPLLAISHLGFFYPLHLILRQFLPGVLTLNLSLFLHVILATAGTYLLLRQEGFKKQPSALGTFVFTGTGFFVGRYYLTNVILPWSWTPLLLWLLGKWFKEKSYQSLIFLSTGIALQVLLGQPQAAMISAFALTAFAAAHLFTGFRQTLARIPALVPAALLTLLLCFVQLGPTLSLVPLSDRSDAMQPEELYEFNFPFYHLVSWVLPHAFGYHEHYIGAKNETELSSWLGSTLLVLIICGIFSVKKMSRRSRYFVALLVLLSLLMISGRISPLYSYLVENHWLDALGVPARWLILLFIALSFLAAHGAEQLINLSKRKRFIWILISALMILVTLFAAWKAIPPEIRPEAKINVLTEQTRSLIPVVSFLIFFWFSLRVKEKNIYILTLIAATEVFIPNITRNVSVPFSQPFHVSKAEQIIKQDAARNHRVFSQRDLSISPKPRVTFHPYKRFNDSIIVKQNFTSTSSLIRGISLDARWGTVPAKDVDIELTLIDKNTSETKNTKINARTAKEGSDLEFIFSTPFSNVAGHQFEAFFRSKAAGPWIMYSKYDGDYLPGGVLEVCQNNTCAPPPIKSTPVDLAISPLYPETNRILLAQEMLAPHIAAAKNISSIQWLGALQLREVKRYLYDMGDQNENAVEHNPFILEKREMFNRLGINYLIGSYEKDRNLGALSGIEKIAEFLFEGQTVRIFRNLEAHPLVKFATNVKSVEHPDEARAVLFESKTKDDPVPVMDDAALRGVPVSTGTAEILSHEPTKVVVKTSNNGTGLLVLRETYFPDWHAYIDGKETRIFPADWIFRGVIVPQGEHEIVFSYEAESTKKSLAISGVSWVSLAAFSLVLVIIKKWKENS